MFVLRPTCPITAFTRRYAQIHEQSGMHEVAAELRTDGEREARLRRSLTNLPCGDGRAAC